MAYFDKNANDSDTAWRLNGDKGHWRVIGRRVRKNSRAGRRVGGARKT